jgi:hypothetical protein
MPNMRSKVLNYILSNETKYNLPKLGLYTT